MPLSVGSWAICHCSTADGFLIQYYSSVMLKGFGLESVEYPGLTRFLFVNRVDRLAHKCRDGKCPEIARRYIRLHHANLPRTRESLPNQLCHLRPDSTPPASTKNKELCYFPHRRIIRKLRPSFH